MTSDGESRCGSDLSVWGKIDCVTADDYLSGGGSKADWGSGYCDGGNGTENWGPKDVLGSTVCSDGYTAHSDSWKWRVC